jgi:hypothetical protein
VTAAGKYDAAAQRYTLTLEQSHGPTAAAAADGATGGSSPVLPLHIPVRVGLLGRAAGGDLCAERVLELREARQVRSSFAAAAAAAATAA